MVKIKSWNIICNIGRVYILSNEIIALSFLEFRTFEWIARQNHLATKWLSRGYWGLESNLYRNPLELYHLENYVPS